ncbi:unnamed protein product, partial [Porites lobata]
PKIRFEEEEGVGSGPLREYFVETIRVLDEGIPSSTGKPLLIIGHSILHGGSGLHGLSPAVKNYLSTDADNEKPSADLKTALDPYMLEAGLDPDQLSFSQNRKLVVESLMTFHVIDKRRLVLDDIIKG